jgi:chromosome segregation ATPase
VRAAIVVLALAVTGCTHWTTVSTLLTHADELVAEGHLDGALRVYEDVISYAPGGREELRARAGRLLVTTTLKTRADLKRLEGELSRLREDVAGREREVQRLTRELTARDGELTRARIDLTARQAELTARQAELTARQAEVVRLTAEAEQLRTNLEDLKRLEIRMERRRQ